MKLARAAVIAMATFLTPALSACTVTPLYGTSATGEAPASDELRWIWLSAPKDRVDQEVRNHLLFNFYRGSARPTDPKYQMDFVLRQRESTGAAYREGGLRPGEEPPSSSNLIIDVVYTLIDIKSGEQIAAGRDSVMTSFDIPQQGFAAARAKKNAEDRAARELAQTLTLRVAADLNRYVNRATRQ